MRRELGKMTHPLSVLFISWIGFVGVVLFLAVDQLEPNPRLAIVLKSALLATAGAAIASHLPF